MVEIKGIKTRRSKQTRIQRRDFVKVSSMRITPPNDAHHWRGPMMVELNRGAIDSREKRRRRDHPR